MYGDKDIEADLKKDMRKQHVVYRRLSAGMFEITQKCAELATQKKGMLPLQRAGAGDLDGQNRSLFAHVMGYFLALEYLPQVASTSDTAPTHLYEAITNLFLAQEPEAVAAYLVHVALRAIIQYEENGVRMATDVRKFRRLLPIVEAMQSGCRSNW